MSLPSMSSIPSIPIAPHSRVPGFVFSAASFGKVLLISSGLEAGFYGSLIGGIKPETFHKIKPAQLGELAKWLQEACLAHIDDIQKIFNAVNTLSVIYYSKKLLDALQDKYHVMPFKPNSEMTDYVLKPLAVSVTAGASILLSIVLWKTLVSPGLAPPQTVVKQLQGGQAAAEFDRATICESTTRRQDISGILQIANIFLQATLTGFTKNYFTSAIVLVTNGYSTFKNRKLKRIDISRLLPVAISSRNNILEVEKAKVTYHLQTFPTVAPKPDASEADKNCPICMDTLTEATRVAFCTTHVFCKTCLPLQVSTSNSFLSGANFLKVRQKDSNFIYYEIKIPHTDLPQCALCKEVPLHNTLDVDEVHDKTYQMDLHNQRVGPPVAGRFTANLTIERPASDRQYLFENLYAVYNIAHAGLSYLQRYPELAATIFKIQQVMLITDMIGYALSTYYAYQHLETKLSDEGYTIQHTPRFKGAAIAAGVLAASISYVAVAQINTYLKSSLLLKDLLAKLPISPWALQNTEISWNSPRSARIMQNLYLHRSVASLALASLSQKRTANLISALAPIFGMATLSRMRWIELTQILEGYNLTCYTNWSSHLSTVKSFKLITHFLLDPSCVKESFHLQSTLKAIHQYTSSLFKGKLNWDAISHNGWLTYFFHLPNILMNPCECACTRAPGLVNFALYPVKYLGTKPSLKVNTGNIALNAARNALSW